MTMLTGSSIRKFRAGRKQVFLPLHLTIWLSVLIAAPLLAENLIALRGARVESPGRADLERGTILIEGTKIKAVSEDVAIPADARVLNMSGKTIWPGIIDPYHVLSIGGGAASRGAARVNGRTTEVRRGSRSSTPNFVRISENFDPFAANFRPLLRSGITHMNLVATGYGEAAVARNTRDRRTILTSTSPTVVFTAITNRTSSLDLLRKGLATAAAKQKSNPESKSGNKESGTERATNRSSTARQRMWMDVHDGVRPLIANTNNSAAILHLLRLLEPYKKVRLAVVARGSDVYQTIDALSAAKPELILRCTVDRVPHTRYRVSVPRLVHEAGISFSFSLSIDGDEMNASQDTPLFPVAYLVKVGLPREVAMQALTSKPAELLGIEETCGSVGEGQLANLLVFDGDPLEAGTHLETVFVEGKLVYDD